MLNKFKLDGIELRCILEEWIQLTQKSYASLMTLRITGKYIFSSGLQYLMRRRHIREDDIRIYLMFV